MLDNVSEFRKFFLQNCCSEEGFASQTRRHAQYALYTVSKSESPTEYQLDHDTRHKDRIDLSCMPV